MVEGPPSGPLPRFPSAYVIVLKAHAPSDTLPPTVPRPFPATSRPLTGSTTTKVAPTPMGSQAAHVLVLVSQAGLVPPHWVSEQQLPGTQEFPPAPGQQMSLGLEQTAPTVEHAAVAHLWVAVSQRNVGPYEVSAWHWESVVQLPQNCGVTRPQIPPLQSASVRQLPGTQLPCLQRWPPAPPSP